MSGPADSGILIAETGLAAEWQRNLAELPGLCYWHGKIHIIINKITLNPHLGAAPPATRGSL